jgi:hypothetical protein
VEILQLPRSLHFSLANIPQLHKVSSHALLQFSQCFNWPTPRLAAISHQPPSLLFTDWLSTDCNSISKSRSHFTTGGSPPISSSLRQAPLRPTTRIVIFQLNTLGYSPYVTSFLKRGWVCRLQFLLTLASAVILSSESRGTHDHILLSRIRDSPNREGQVPVFIFPRNRVTQLYPKALGSLFIASYDSQGYGGGIRPRLHTGWL